MILVALTTKSWSGSTTVGKTNDEQRLWINGRLVIEQTGMEWRKTDKLVLNNIMLPMNLRSVASVA